mmetsp:Transcript_86756/g.158420  ORF Transcript_86756/g.158420 Transcript_86756/m.158420 type:complete len:213 (-) Transcript_86756:59-697(-)
MAGPADRFQIIDNAKKNRFTRQLQKCGRAPLRLVLEKEQPSASQSLNSRLSCWAYILNLDIQVAVLIGIDCKIAVEGHRIEVAAVQGEGGLLLCTNQSFVQNLEDKVIITKPSIELDFLIPLRVQITLDGLRLAERLETTCNVSCHFLGVLLDNGNSAIRRITCDIFLFEIGGGLDSHLDCLRTLQWGFHAAHASVCCLGDVGTHGRHKSRQ